MKYSMHRAARYGDISELERIAADSPVNARNSVGETPMHEAAVWGQLDALKWLLASGGDVTTQNNSGCTPADLARLFDHADAVEVLAVKEN